MGHLSKRSVAGTQWVAVDSRQPLGISGYCTSQLPEAARVNLDEFDEAADLRKTQYEIQFGVLDSARWSKPSDVGR